MSRLRRPFLYDRYIFMTVDLLRSRGRLEERDYARLAIALARMQQKQVVQRDISGHAEEKSLAIYRDLALADCLGRVRRSHAILLGSVTGDPIDLISASLFLSLLRV
jgi:hypothetical protein